MAVDVNDICSFSLKGAASEDGHPGHQSCQNTGRGFSGDHIGCKWCRVCIVHIELGDTTCFVGAGSPVLQRGRGSLSARNANAGAGSAGSAQPPGRCFAGYGGRVALPFSRRSYRRDLGRTFRTRLHCNQTFGTAIRGKCHTLLASAPCRITRPKCGAQPLARRLAALKNQPRRCHVSGRSALADRVVQIPSGTTRYLGGNL